MAVSQYRYNVTDFELCCKICLTKYYVEIFNDTFTNYDAKANAEDIQNLYLTVSGHFAVNGGKIIMFTVLLRN